MKPFAEMANINGRKWQEGEVFDWRRESGGGQVEDKR
jgi:hypothetical protein